MLNRAEGTIAGPYRRSVGPQVPRHAVGPHCGRRPCSPNSLDGCAPLGCLVPGAAWRAGGDSLRRAPAAAAAGVGTAAPLVHRRGLDVRLAPQRKFGLAAGRPDAAALLGVAQETSPPGARRHAGAQGAAGLCRTRARAHAHAAPAVRRSRPILCASLRTGAAAPLPPVRFAGILSKFTCMNHAPATAPPGALRRAPFCAVCKTHCGAVPAPGRHPRARRPCRTPRNCVSS